MTYGKETMTAMAMSYKVLLMMSSQQGKTGA